MLIRARIFKSSKRVFECLVESSHEIVTATALATLLKEDHLVVGDWVGLIAPPKETDDWVISEVEERSNKIFRNLPREQKQKIIASNVDLLMIVTNAGKPDYKRGLVDRYLARSFFWGIPAIVIFNKMDLYSTEQFDIKFESDRLKHIGVSCFEVSAENPTYENRFLLSGLKELKDHLRNKTAILLGHSGVGKSKLISHLSEGRVQVLSGELGKVGKGAHTTTWAELIHAGEFSLIDSPGIRSMSLLDLTSQELLESFPDIYEMSLKCQFSSNCKHEESSKGCYFYKNEIPSPVKSLVLSRLESFKRILEEVESIPDWQKRN
jgi:ribosome biogenesis GTPase